MKSKKSTIKRISNDELGDTIYFAGKVFDSFERVSKIKEIILLGEDDSIRRIILE